MIKNPIPAAVVRQCFIPVLLFVLVSTCSQAPSGKSGDSSENSSGTVSSAVSSGASVSSLSSSLIGSSSAGVSSAGSQALSSGSSISSGTFSSINSSELSGFSSSSKGTGNVVIIGTISNRFSSSSQQSSETSSESSSLSFSSENSSLAVFSSSAASAYPAGQGTGGSVTVTINGEQRTFGGYVMVVMPYVYVANTYADLLNTTNKNMFVINLSSISSTGTYAMGLTGPYIIVYDHYSINGVNITGKDYNTLMNVNMTNTGNITLSQYASASGQNWVGTIISAAGMEEIYSGGTTASASSNAEISVEFDIPRY